MIHRCSPPHMPNLKEKFEELSNNQKFVLIGSVGALFLILVLFWATRGSHAASDAAVVEGTKYTCQNPACRHEFRMTVAEARENMAKHPNEGLKCPKCGSTNVVPEGGGSSRRRTESTKP
jgi:hypothetical protein